MVYVRIDCSLWALKLPEVVSWFQAPLDGSKPKCPSTQKTESENGKSENTSVHPAKNVKGKSESRNGKKCPSTQKTKREKSENGKIENPSEYPTRKQEKLSSSNMPWKIQDDNRSRINWYLPFLVHNLLVPVNTSHVLCRCLQTWRQWRRPNIYWDGNIVTLKKILLFNLLRKNWKASCKSQFSCLPV